MENKNSIVFYELDWDTKFFGISCAKAVLNTPIENIIDWDVLIDKFNNYDFISIVNKNADSVNSRLIGIYTNAFLVDTNIQFKKKLKPPYTLYENINIYSNLKMREDILEIADFKYSKFTEDPGLNSRNGKEVYIQWLINAFSKKDKFFAIYEDIEGLKGFVLYSYLSEDTCIIELIAVSNGTQKSGIGSKLFQAVEFASSKIGCKYLMVGTQQKNINAINFYHKMQCKEVGCHQVYHLWKEQKNEKSSNN